MFNWSRTISAVCRAGLLREWSQGEHRLYKVVETIVRV